MIEAKGRGPKDVPGLACGFFVIRDEMLHGYWMAPGGMI
jgi:hypothetical protein